MKKYALLPVLAALLLLSSCGSAETAAKETENTGNVPETEEAVTEVNPYDPGLPDADFGGYQFTFAVRGDGSGSGAWHSTDLVSDGLNGETLNDAIFERTSYIEEKYHVKFDLMWCGETSVALTGSEMSKAVNKVILAGEDSIDAILSSPYDTVGYMINDFIVDLNTVEYLDLSQPWWNQNVCFGNCGSDESDL